MSPSDDQRAAAARTAEARYGLFEMIAILASLAASRGERAVALMLVAIVKAYE